MRHKKNGKNLLEKCCFILFDTAKDERFLLYVLKEVPGVTKYLYITDQNGWFPIFRILHLF